VTVFLSSHILGEIRHLADRIGIIHRGRLVEEISGEELVAARSSGVEITVSDVPRAARALAESLGVTARVETAPGGLTILDGNVRPEEIARTVVTAGVSLLRLCPVSEDLEMRFLRLTGEES
jgi:ABC-type multidrug transport system ATPase subunit